MADAMAPIRAVDPANIDPAVSPADDFYRYASGTWLKNNPIPEEYSRWGCFEELHEQAQAHIRAILDACADDVRAAAAAAGAGAAAPAGPALPVHDRLVGAFYASGMDAPARDAAAMAPMADVYAAIAAAETAADCMVLSAALKREYGVPAAGFWGMYDSVDAKDSAWTVMYVVQSGLGIGDRDYYVSEDAAKQEIRAKYAAHVARTLALAGVPGDVAAKAAAVLALETEMARAHLTKVEKRDPHRVYNKFSGPAALAEATASHAAPWARYFAAAGLEGEDFGGLVLDNTNLAARMADLLGDASVALDTWKCYLTYHVTKAMAPYLGSAAVEENFGFHVGVMTGQPKMKPLWKRVSAQVGSCVEESLGILYVDKHFSPEAKRTCHEMCDYLVDVLAARFDHDTGVSWMSAATKTRAMEKLKAFRYKIGYPDVWDIKHCPALSEEVSLDASYAMNIRAAAKSDVRRSLMRSNKPVDKERWAMPAFIINACFSPTRNEILFPSAILQAPFFIAPTPGMPQGDVAVNFAAIGAVICHEISHGFDDKGREYDQAGMLNDWWTEEDSAEYNRRTELMVEQFNNYKVFGSSVNGKLCLGENVADLGGVKLAYIGFQKFMKENGRPEDMDGFTPEQRFFLSWANVWKNNIRQAMAEQRLIMDPHSPGEWRANGPLSLLPEFHKAFNVQPGDKMFVPEAKRCEIW